MSIISVLFFFFVDMRFFNFCALLLLELQTSRFESNFGLIDLNLDLGGACFTDWNRKWK